MLKKLKPKYTCRYIYIYILKVSPNVKTHNDDEAIKILFTDYEKKLRVVINI